MQDPHRMLAEFLGTNGIGPWVKGPLGQTQRVEDWVDEYLNHVADAVAEDDHDDAVAAREVRAFMDQHPNQKSISVKKLREIMHVC